MKLGGPQLCRVGQEDLALVLQIMAMIAVDRSIRHSLLFVVATFPYGECRVNAEFECETTFRCPNEGNFSRGLFSRSSVTSAHMFVNKFPRGLAKPKTILIFLLLNWLTVIMAGGNNKKKKKPVANPARGFATTSIVSKQKAGTLQDNISTDASEVGSPATAPTSVASEHVKSIEATAAGDERELHELSPEELEAQLEISELQQLVEKHAVKTRKEASRQVSRLQIDRRILRGQAEQLSVREWLPDELMQQILELTLQEAQGNFSKPEQAVARTPLTEDALLAKVWQLRLCLLELDIPSARVEGVLKYLISHPPSEESATQLWGLPEALDWLALRCRSDELLDYDTERSIQARYSAANSRPGRPDIHSALEYSLDVSVFTDFQQRHPSKDPVVPQAQNRVEGNVRRGRRRTRPCPTQRQIVSRCPRTISKSAIWKVIWNQASSCPSICVPRSNYTNSTQR